MDLQNLASSTSDELKIVVYCAHKEKNSMPQFLEKIAEVLEVPSVTPDFAFRSAPG